MKLKKKELVFFGAVLIIALIWSGIQLYMRSRTKYGSIRIMCRGQVYGEYSLGKDLTIQINDTNTLEIKDGKAKMIDAKCPDHICMYMPAINETHDSIVCLPNQVIGEVLEE